MKTAFRTFILDSFMRFIKYKYVDFLPVMVSLNIISASEVTSVLNCE